MFREARIFDKVAAVLLFCLFACNTTPHKKPECNEVRLTCLTLVGFQYSEIDTIYITAKNKIQSNTNKKRYTIFVEYVANNPISYDVFLQSGDSLSTNDVWEIVTSAHDTFMVTDFIISPGWAQDIKEYECGIDSSFVNSQWVPGGAIYKKNLK